MNRTAISILAAGAAIAALSAPAAASQPQPLPVPNPITCQLSDVSGAIACAGYYGGNIFSNSPADQGTQTNALTYLGFSGIPDYNTIYASGSGLKLDNLNGTTTLSFPGAPVLFGITFVGVHWGNQSAVYKLNLLSPVSSLTIKSQNPGGSSNAVLFGTSPVPEPASWAMMIAGFGIVGAAMRRTKAKAAVTFA